jgi:DNA-binding NtrC family response regulator
LPITINGQRIGRTRATVMPVPPLTPLEVLVVDDEEEIRELLVEYFRDRGFETSTAADGRAAITAIERDPARYRLILTDLQMPGADGLAVLRAAKAANPSCYVVIITGYASLDSAVQAVRGGAYDYLTKPFSMGQIDVVVQRVTDRVALEAENRQLTRQLGARVPQEREMSPEMSASIAARLDTVENRLSRIEALLRDLSDRLDRTRPLPPR